MKCSKSNRWYAAGLHFECGGCGTCCAGPEEGYIWISKAEIGRVAEYLKLREEQFRKKFIRRSGFRTSILEHPQTHDCIFLTDFGGGRRGCAIYPVRPTQCRTWPFWRENLQTPAAWKAAAMRCPGIDRGPLFGAEQIEQKKNSIRCTQKPPGMNRILEGP